jgi:hypothetical protein
MRYMSRWRCAECSKLPALTKFPVNRENNRENERKQLPFGPQSPVFIEQS